MMEDQCSQVIEEGLNYFRESKFSKLDDEVLSSLLPASSNTGHPLQSMSPGKEQTSAHSPAPPTPPMEEHYISLLEDKTDNSAVSTELGTSDNQGTDGNEKLSCSPMRDQIIERPSEHEVIAPSLQTINVEESEDLSTQNTSSPAKQSLDDSALLRKELKHAMDPLTIPCLQSVKDLRKKYGTKYKLHFKVSKGSNRYLSAYKRKWDLLLRLEEWENTLNSSSPHEPYISVENKVDNCGPPEGFVYITKSIMPSNVDYLFDKNYLVGCECVRCTPLTCDCTKNSGSDFAYDRIGRVLFEPGKPIYECNSSCYCSVSCRNRVVQRGRTVRVTIFRTPNGCGWGVKTMDPILKNQFVTEYVGEVLTSEEAEERGKLYDHVGMTYLFDLDYNDDYAAYTIDAKTYGNISHFINHSCDPNLNVYGVWIETLDPQMPQIAFFARRDIKAGEELTFDYLMYTEAGSSSKSKSKPKPVPCFCGAKNCRKYML